jgi:hypothetical protein
MSKSPRTLQSSDVQSILGYKGEIRLPLFIQKSNDEGEDHYYMGELSPVLKEVEETAMNNNKGKQVSVVKIRYNLSVPLTDNMFRYICNYDKRIDAERPEQKVFQSTIDSEPILHNPIPLFDFYAAAGTFSEIQSEKEFTLIEGPENSKSDYFACKIVGESMSRIIPNGSICLFKPYTGGSRNDKIVLVENIDMQDQDFNSAFTIKTYSSKKTISEEGWEHTSIVLRPNSFDDSYKNIIINQENGDSMRVVGEFISIITTSS